MQGWFSSLRFRVLLLIGIPFALLLGMVIYYALGERENRLAQARTRVLETARAMAGEQQRIIEHIHQVLSSAARLSEVRRGDASDACHQTLAAWYRQEPSLINILVARPNGDVTCSARPTAAPINLADRSFFKAALQTRTFAHGGYVLSRTTGQPAIGFSYPVLDEAGVPQAVVSTTLSLAWLKQELAKAQLPDGARVGVVDGDGMILGRHPDPEKWAGRRIPESPLLRGLLARGGEGTAEATGLDGLRRIFGYIPLHRTTSGQTYLWVAIPRDVVVGPVERVFVMNLMLALVLLVLTFGAVWLGGEWLFVRRLAALMGAAKELGQGHLDSRTGLKASGDEIGQLAQSFDRMAEGLQTKDAQLSRVVRALRVLSAGNHTMLHAKEGEQPLLQEMCRVIVEVGGYRMAWVGYAENDTEKRIRPVARFGNGVEGYFENTQLTWNETGSGRAPPGRAIRTGMPVVVSHIQGESDPQPWRDAALRCGFGSCLALPLRLNGRVIGVLDICAEERDAFSDEEVELLSSAAADLSFGIANGRAEAEQARMKQTLRSAEERLKAAVEASLDALFIAKSVRDKDGSIVDFEFTDINAHAEEMLGMTRDKVIGQKLCELLPINRTGGFFDKYTRVVATGTPLEEEFPLDTPEVQAKWLRHQVVRVHDGIAIASRDITQWKAAGARLKESEERLRLATAAAHMGAWTWDLKSNRFSLSEGIGPVFGLPPGAGYETPEALIEAVYPADRDLLARALSAGREAGTPMQVEFRTTWPDGTLHWVEGRSSFTRNTNGIPERGVGIAMDITERKHSEQSLRESEETFRTLSASAQDAIIMLDNDGNIVFWNAAAEKIFGYTSEEAAGKNLHFLLAPARFHEAYRTGFRHFQSSGEGAAIGKTLELAALRKDGSEFSMELSLSAVKLMNQWSAVGIVRDITERKQSEQALLRANRALRALSACNEKLVHATDELELVRAICQLVVETGGYRMAWVGYAEQDPAKTVRVVAHYGAENGYLATANITWADTERGRGPIGTAIRTGGTQVNQNTQTNPDLDPWREAALARGFQSGLALPLKGPSGVLGALTLYAGETDRFSASEVQLLEELADDLAFGIVTLRTRAEHERIAYAHQHHEEILRKSLEDSIQAIANTVEMRDPYTAGHQSRVGKLAVAIASELGLVQDVIHGLRLAASIHDLGKIHIPAEILSKPGKLSAIELALIQTHPQAGYDILKGIAFPWPIATMVWQHHERLDGSGYPQGLKGEQILLESQILAVADVVESMASHRPYRPARGIDAALEEIERGRSTAYEPAVVDACLKLFRQGQFALQV